MSPRFNFMQDAQAALGFLISQVSHIETEVIQIRYPEIQYPALIPVDSSAPEWAKSVTFFSLDRAGRADWFNHMATDMRLADVERTRYEHGIDMAGIGYRYTLEEIGQAMLMRMNLTSEKADAARRAAEEFIDDKALNGDSARNWSGLFNDPNVTVVNAPADGNSNGGVSSAAWEHKTATQIIRDFNVALTGIYTASLTVEMANTVLLPIAVHALLASTERASGSDMTVLAWLERYNTYTSQTKQPLEIRGVRGLENAGAGGDVGRMIVYRRDPQVLKLHLPMPHRFMPVWQRGPLSFDVPGILRMGGVEIRRPGAVRYVDGISNYTS